MASAKQFQFAEIGARLRAYRLGKGISPEDLADRIGISRAALYRAEKGEIRKIDTLTSIADVLKVSLPSLMGVGVEYVSTAVAFFERMRQLEEECQQIIGLFSPISYLLTSDNYDRVLREVLMEANQPLDLGERSKEEAINELLAVLQARKRTFREKAPLIVSLISTGDLERFLVHGLVGRYDLAPTLVRERRRMACQEARHIVDIIQSQPMGIQVGLVQEPIPATSFQIFRQADRSVLAISPYRLGEQPNIRLGVALITSAPEAMTLHESIANRLWGNSLKGDAAVRHINGMIEKFGQTA